MSTPFTLAGVAGKIECPLLVVHGENDRIVPLDSARRLYDAAGSKRKTLKIFTAAEGGAEHCQVDNRQVGVDYIADWLAPIFLERGAWFVGRESTRSPPRAVHAP